jgi:hypothetical protein
MTVIQPVAPIQIHQTYFTPDSQTKFAIQIMEMVDSYFIWVGDGTESVSPSGMFSQLAVAMPNRFVCIVSPGSVDSNGIDIIQTYNRQLE